MFNYTLLKLRLASVSIELASNFYMWLLSTESYRLCNATHVDYIMFEIS